MSKGTVWTILGVTVVVVEVVVAAVVLVPRIRLGPAAAYRFPDDMTVTVTQWSTESANMAGTLHSRVDCDHPLVWVAEDHRNPDPTWGWVEAAPVKAGDTVAWSGELLDLKTSRPTVPTAPLLVKANCARPVATSA